MPNVKETLYELKKQGARLFIYTHRGKTLSNILINLGLDGIFEEVVDSTNGFPRKPDGSANKYLVDKYHLDRNNTYYVGDRELDILCANDAGIKSVLYLTSGIEINAKATYRIKDFKELLQIKEN